MRAADTTQPRRARAEEGFTLVEVLVAIVILVFGLIAITNLFVMAASSNVVARNMSAAAAQAAEAMEQLKGIPFGGVLATNAPKAGNLDITTTAASGRTWTQDQPIQVDMDKDRVVDNYEADRLVSGVGVIRVRWQIVRIDGQTLLLRVVAAGASPIVRARSRVELTTFRSCTGPNNGCPDTP